METIKSVGKCSFCNETFSKSGIGRHLQKHIQDKVLLSQSGKSFMLKVEQNPKWGSTPYFLMLWIDGETKIQKLDSFLRQIWLECCGHMSSFTNPKMVNRGGMFDFFGANNFLEHGNAKEYEKFVEESSGEIGMSKKANKTLSKDLKLIYQYDFGSTTELLVTVINEFPIKADDSIVLLSRNEPPNLPCDLCGNEAATQICAVCASYKDEVLFCKKCAKKHAKTCDDFAEYAAMPVVNSPRMGVCAYEGGRIDKKRDGIFIK